MIIILIAIEVCMSKNGEVTQSSDILSSKATLLNFLHKVQALEKAVKMVLEHPTDEKIKYCRQMIAATKDLMQEP